MAVTASRSTRRTTADWHALIHEHHASGLSAAAFCRQHDLVYQTFVARRRKLDNEKSPTVVSSLLPAAPPSLPSFVEIGVAEPNLSHEAPRNEWLVELDLGGGMQLRIRSPH